MTKITDPVGPVAALKLPRQNAVLITYAKGVHDAWQGNASLPNPPIPLAVFAADIAAFADAETKASGKGKGMAKLRNARKKKVKEDLGHFRDYAQSVAEVQTSDADAAAVIESAFMSVRKVGKHVKPPLAARNTGIPGSVALDAKAVAPRTTYYWEYSLDQKNWSHAPDTMRARTTIVGLTSAQTYYFRFRALTHAGPVDYSQIVSLLVH